jgi:hypothetical protein
MKLICPIILLFLLSGAAAQLAPDRERFDVELHPGEVMEKTMTLKNIGDKPVFEITKSPVGGSAKDLILLDVPEEKVLDPGDKAEVKVFFVVPPEIEPGTYTGLIYLFDDALPSMPTRVEFRIQVIKQESYGISLSINDAKSASARAEPDDYAEFDLTVANLGKFRDVASIDVVAIPAGWTASLLDGDDEVEAPYTLPLASGVSHEMKVQVKSSTPGERGAVSLMAASLGNRSQNATVKAEVEFGMAVRGYNVKIELPEKMVVNRTYTGSLRISLDVKERIWVAVMTPDQLMVMLRPQVVPVSPDDPGRANLTLLAAHPGRYPLIFKLVDSNGVSMPDELAKVEAVLPEGTAIVTGEDLIHTTIASLCSPENRSLPVVSIPPGRLSEKDKGSLFAYASLVILGNESIVSPEAERILAEAVEVKRMGGKSIFETSWRFTSEMWRNGTAEVVVSGPREIDVFRAYQQAKLLNLPLVVCDSEMTDAVRSVVSEMTQRRIRLSKILAIGGVRDDTVKAFKDMGLSVEVTI